MFGAQVGAQRDSGLVLSELNISIMNVCVPLWVYPSLWSVFGLEFGPYSFVPYPGRFIPNYTVLCQRQVLSPFSTWS